ncbi:uncharacterized protein LACBIDRAFT_328036 [Laccaria bicolor S238N-H82]|uniref:Predicted protein n=1 Tax=Laccaria bicolor (strain S238N-H82 / ATCC MYA-4686) TaxID=486041 RepID=B0DE91_LACBS|nr:uncharacterized protein LACBIDRAFT_328036 [Laccaria bicolor S238N-H82]EDR07096.1 predicted protein [Laccaria bicolor S238N-H82]|eukprot:XP_001882027.1 predicted protein [Laccaria bicolor S238N-H82]
MTVSAEVLDAVVRVLLLEDGPRALEYQQMDAQERGNVRMLSCYRRNSLERLNFGHPLSQRDPPLLEDDRPKPFPFGRDEDTLDTGEGGADAGGASTFKRLVLEQLELNGTGLNYLDELPIANVELIYPSSFTQRWALVVFPIPGDRNSPEHVHTVVSRLFETRIPGRCNPFHLMAVPAQAVGNTANIARSSSVYVGNSVIATKTLSVVGGQGKDALDEVGMVDGVPVCHVNVSLVRNGGEEGKKDQPVNSKKTDYQARQIEPLYNSHYNSPNHPRLLQWYRASKSSVSTANNENLLMVQIAREEEIGGHQHLLVSECAGHFCLLRAGHKKLTYENSGSTINNKNVSIRTLVIMNGSEGKEEVKVLREPLKKNEK